MMHWLDRRNIYLCLFFIIALVSAGCASLLPTPPRLEEQANAAEGISPTPVRYPAPTPTGSAADSALSNEDAMQSVNPSVTLWVNETSVAHVQQLESMKSVLANEYALNLDYILVDEAQLPTLIQTAVLSDTLPDLILHPIEYSITWANDGILDPAATTSVIDTLGRDTFSAKPLSFVTLPDNQVASIPSNGYPQIFLYRQDWLNTLGLSTPDNFDTLRAASEAIYNSPDIAAQTGISETLISGIVLSTESDRIETHHSFEQFSIANNCRLIDEKGEVILQQEFTCLQTIEYYQQLINQFSPADIQTPTTAVSAYLGGRTGIILTNPSTYEALSGFDPDYQPQCPECAADPAFLLGRTGMSTTFGNQNTSFARLFGLGITTSADTESAARFAAYWFDEGYIDWIGVEPEHKIPLRVTDSTGTDLLGTWRDLPLENGEPPLKELIGEDRVQQIEAAVANSSRWGFEKNQGDVIGRLHAEEVLAIRLQEMLSGYYSPQQALIEATNELVDLIPGYAYYTEPQPDPEQSDG